MDILDSKSDEELLKTIVGEIAKAGNEIKCARADLDKAANRQKFLLVLAHKLIERKIER